MRAMQRAVFDIPDPFLNPRVNCDALPGVDLDLWKERVTCKGRGRESVAYDMWHMIKIYKPTFQRFHIKSKQL